MKHCLVCLDCIDWVLNQKITGELVKFELLNIVVETPSCVKTVG